MNSTQNGLHERLRGVFESAGYRRFKMSKFEEYDLYAKNKDFLVSENVLTFTDLDGRLMALKPDVTLSIVKNSRDSEGIEKVYYHENVYRASGGSLGFREISQAGLECIGEIDEYCVCEVLSLAAKSLMQIRPKYVFSIMARGAFPRRKPGTVILFDCCLKTLFTASSNVFLSTVIVSLCLFFSISFTSFKLMAFNPP